MILRFVSYNNGYGSLHTINITDFLCGSLLYGCLCCRQVEIEIYDMLAKAECSQRTDKHERFRPKHIILCMMIKQTRETRDIL